ncbi:MAG: hypothetical protein N2Z85_00165 [Patescibacteria group bacterium]|nr:hypothetical protein [Patescibacteria group bacterium]
MKQNFESKNQKNNQIDFESLNKRILINQDVVDKLYKLFIPAINFNNPRNRYVLENNDYTIPYLAHRLELPENEVLYIFRQIPFCRIFLSKNNIRIVHFIDFENFKKIILYKYNYFENINKINKNIVNKKIKRNEKLNLEVNLDDEKTLKSQIELVQKLKELNDAELKYLKLIILKNPSGKFNINRSGVTLNQLEKELQNVHLNKIIFLNKLKALDLIKINGPKVEIKSNVLDYFNLERG